MSRDADTTPPLLATAETPPAPPQVHPAGVTPAEPNHHGDTLRWIVPSPSPDQQDPLRTTQSPPTPTNIHSAHSGAEPQVFLDDQATPAAPIPTSVNASTALGAAPSAILRESGITPRPVEAMTQTPPAEVFAPTPPANVLGPTQPQEYYPPTPPPKVFGPPAKRDEYPPTPPPQAEIYPPTPPPEVFGPTPDLNGKQTSPPLRLVETSPALEVYPPTPPPKVLAPAPQPDEYAPTPPLEAFAPLHHSELSPSTSQIPELIPTPLPAVHTPTPPARLFTQTPPPLLGAPQIEQAIPPEREQEKVSEPLIEGLSTPMEAAEGDLELLEEKLATTIEHEDADFNKVGPTPPPVPQFATLATRVDASFEKRTPPPIVPPPTPPPVVVPSILPPKARHLTPPPIAVPDPATISAPSPSTTTGNTPSAPRAPTFQNQTEPASELPEALARRSLQKGAKPWFEEIFDEDFLRTLPIATREQTNLEAEFLSSVFKQQPSAELLDVACGYGQQAMALSQKGFRVTGIDLSLPLLLRAADDAQKQNLSVNFVHADMREIAYHAQFDGAYCMHSSFGYFDEDANLKTATALFNALKPGARFVLDVINRDYVVGDIPSRVWWEGNACVVLEEVDFNFQTSRILIHRSIVFGEGRQVEQEISLRAYSLHEIGRLLRTAGFRILEVSGSLHTRGSFFGAASRNIIAVCEKPFA